MSVNINGGSPHNFITLILTYSHRPTEYANNVHCIILINVKSKIIETRFQAALFIIIIVVHIIFR